MLSNLLKIHALVLRLEQLDYESPSADSESLDIAREIKALNLANYNQLLGIPQ